MVKTFDYTNTNGERLGAYIPEGISLAHSTWGHDGVRQRKKVLRCRETIVRYPTLAYDGVRAWNCFKNPSSGRTYDIVRRRTMGSTI